MYDPLDSSAKDVNWLTGESYTTNRQSWADVWSKFPIYTNKEKLKALENAFKSADVTILVSGTGSGKTVLAVPLMLKTILSQRDSAIDRPASVVATMPKRATVLAAAHTGAKTLDVAMGKQVGYKYRDSEKGHSIQKDHGSKGSLLYATDGYVLAQSRRDPMMSEYDAVIIDEAHERGVPSDMLMLAVLKAQKARNSNIAGAKKKPLTTGKLRFVVMSATIDPIPLERYFQERLGEGAVIRTIIVPGQSFHPVERIFLKSKSLNPIDDAMTKAVDIVNSDRRGQSGKVMIFVPTTRDASTGCEAFRIACKRKSDVTSSCRRIACASLYGKQTRDQQLTALQDTNKDGTTEDDDGYVIVSTNVAESSLTIKNVRHVVDTGLQVVNRWMPAAHGARITVEMASKAQIAQRVGRTGRTAPGIAHLMYTCKQFEDAPSYPVPSILSTDITEHLFEEMCSRQPDHESSPTTTLEDAADMFRQLFTPPSEEQIKGANAMLCHCEIINSKRRVTSLGRKCYELMRMTKMDLWSALLVARAASSDMSSREEDTPTALRDALHLVAILETMSQGADLWWDTKKRVPMSAPDEHLVEAYGGDRESDHVSLVQTLQGLAMPAFQEDEDYEVREKSSGKRRSSGKEALADSLMLSTWGAIVKRANDLAKERIIKRCRKLFKDEFPTTKQDEGGVVASSSSSSGILDAIRKSRSYHKTVDGMAHVGSGTKVKSKYAEPWFVDPKRAARLAVYEFMTCGGNNQPAKLAVLTLADVGK